MAVDISAAARNAAADAIVDLADAGAGAATIVVRSGAKPANTAAADTGTLLSTLTMADPAFGSAAAGVATAAAIGNDTNAAASGTPGYFRIRDSDTTVLLQGTAGVGSGDMNFDQTIVATGTVAITSLTVTMPETGA